ncbi:MAG: hypothetical protein UT32_C0013G0010 [Parcubacteria group bacterium GW2011_GWC2_39_14]|nr:MAG: hypothetical protein UT32_C0013G0010 [Parcubacteria group bacterium GW2011_GWC2_39_14]KKR54498.1 MAG: hypothetical protein UT91_C0014G0010 [Parcubacteria group bacterium GW2011_GWA2_40_23]
MAYSKVLMDHFKSPHNQGTIANADGVGEVGNIRCGDIMKIYIDVDKNDKGADYLKDVKFETLGCAAAIAASSVLTDLAIGKTLDQALAITKDDIVKVLENVPPLKYHCSILAEEGLKKAIEEYKQRKN